MSNNTAFIGNASEEPLLNYTAQFAIDKYTTPFLYIIGFPGNIISLIIWMQKRMRHSSGCYLAALALDDLIFLSLHPLFELTVTWGIDTLSYPVLCQVYPVIFLASQYLSPFLVLAFTTERYISICHPFKREKFCTVTRAKHVIGSLAVAMLCLTGVNGYFFTMQTINGTSTCLQRDEVLDGQSKSVFTIYNMVVELLAFFMVPVTVLVLNILVIREMRRLSRVELTQLQGTSQRTSATTVMLLAVSFYQIITTLPISITYALFFQFDYDTNKEVLGTELASKRYRIYQLIMAVIKEYGITHYAFNIFIYIITGKMFRQEVKKLFLRPFSKIASSLPGDYTSLRTSVRGSERMSKTWVSVNGNHDAEKSRNETLL